MTLVLVVRHGLTSSTGKALTGWMPGISLDDRGQAQAAAVGSRLAQVPLAAIVSSPLDRCRETAAAIASRQERPAADPAGTQAPVPAPDPEANGSGPPSAPRSAAVTGDWSALVSTTQVTYWSAMALLGYRIDSNRFSRLAFLPIIDRSGPTEPPTP